MSTKRLLMFFALTLFFSSCSNVIDIENKKWACKHQQCQIIFTIKNNESIEQTRNFRISAYRRRDLGNDAYATDSIGKKIVKFNLKPKQEIEVTETLKLLVPTTPSYITISHFEEKQAF